MDVVRPDGWQRQGDTGSTCGVGEPCISSRGRPLRLVPLYLHGHVDAVHPGVAALLGRLAPGHLSLPPPADLGPPAHDSASVLGSPVGGPRLLPLVEMIGAYPPAMCALCGTHTHPSGYAASSTTNHDPQRAPTYSSTSS